MARFASVATSFRWGYLFGVSLILLASTVLAADEVGANLALGKKVTLAPTPNYQHCTDAEDSIQLTDGQLTEGNFWTQKGCVGWNGEPYVEITVDLGRIEPISGASLRTAAGAAEVTWPNAVLIAVSDDGKEFREVGDLVGTYVAEQGDWPKGYAVRQLAARHLATRGRFVRFLVVPSGAGYVFCDEVEVFRGPAALVANEPGGKPLGKMDERLAEAKLTSRIQRGLIADTVGVTRAIDQAAGLDATVKSELSRRAADAAKKVLSTPVPLEDTFRAVLPFNGAHAELFAVQAALWKALGRPGLTAWTPPTWDPVDLFAVPPAATSGKIEVHAMRGEYRAAAFNLANSTDRAKQVRLQVDGLPGSPTPGCLTVAEVPWTDTVHGVPVAAALPEVASHDGAWTVTVPPGMVRQVWITFHPTDVPPGAYAGAAVIAAEGDATQRIPVELHVYPMEFPKETTLLVGGWSYTNGGGAYGLTEQNREAFLEHMRDHFVNAPWASPSAMARFEKLADGGVKLDTAEFDNWIAEWPNAKKYMVFLALSKNNNVAKTFHGTTIGTPECDRLVGVWISAWVKHLRDKGITPDRLGLLIHDEPYEGIDVGPAVALARAIHAAEPEVLVWNDPIYREPWEAPAALFETSTVLCPNRPMWLREGKRFAEFFVDQHRQGRVLHFYSCSGPAKSLDPYSYYRLQAWDCWRVGATASFFWAFGDNGYASSWNEYRSKHGPFTPLFIDATTVTPGKQMEAIRESVEDYETFVMLRAAVDRAKAAGRSDAAVTEAEPLLKTAAAEVLDAKGTDDIRWHEPKDRATADAVRARLLKALAALL